MLSRRKFIKVAGSTAGLLITEGCQYNTTRPAASAHVVIIGGGFGGATAAKYIKKLDANIRVTLIEPNSQYITCPGSNGVITGITNFDKLTFSYKLLAERYAINFVADRVSQINSVQHFVVLSDLQKIHYDRLIVSPGIDFRWEMIEGHNESTTNQIPHAWKAGEQTLLLSNQLHSMRDGGNIVICAPPNPYRCPPGPYERASMMASYLIKYKPKSKILILDPKTHFSKQGLFEQGWRKYYNLGDANNMIEWISVPDNPVVNIDVKKRTVETDFGDVFKADVLNYIPAQKAGKIAQIAGLCDESGWCPVDNKTSESTLLADIHVIGDASSQKPLPKSAFAANSEAKVCAFAVVSLLNEWELTEPSWVNTCYSLITESHAISVAMVYKLDSGGNLIKVDGAGGVTPNIEDKTLAMEAENAKKWYKNITADSFS